MNYVVRVFTDGWRTDIGAVADNSWEQAVEIARTISERGFVRLVEDGIWELVLPKDIISIKILEVRHGKEKEE